MKREMITLPLVFVALALTTFFWASLVLAWDGYDLPWWTVDGGGVTFSTGGGYTLGGTIGQPDARVLSGGAYTLAGGFWGGAAPPPPPGYRIYLPIVLKNYP